MKTVTLGFDGLPTILLENDCVLPRKAELIIHSEYYKNWPDEVWPVDPITGNKLEIECEKKKEAANVQDQAARNVIQLLQSLLEYLNNTPKRLKKNVKR